MSRGIGGHTTPNRGKTDTWITPPWIIDALGPFDLDPCQATPQPLPCATYAFGLADDGLRRQWHGRVWMNPPYSEIGSWMAKLATHGTGTALVFARTETRWFRDYVWSRAAAVMFLHGRLRFLRPTGEPAKGNSGGPSCLVAYGTYDADRLATSGVAGTVVKVVR